ncbi:uncharacterized protein YukE [Nitrobacteraceae bacterium AZCC 1564]
MSWVGRLLIWNGYVRILAFWTVVISIIAGLEYVWPAFNANLIQDVTLRAVAGQLEGVSTPEFAFSLAAGLCSTAVALLVAFLLLHVIAILLSLWFARRMVTRHGDMIAFAEAYEDVYGKLSRHALIGHAWREFDETLVLPGDLGQPVCNTIRPQAFLNLGVARDKLFGLKMMGSIPGYFVGIGLLLTFIGLVLALNKAAMGASSADAGAMQNATRELLQVATFKFATSIAGLGASIALSLCFRTFTIWMEDAFNAFCHAVEAKLKYTAPQSIAVEMSALMAQQVAELKSINSEAFFTRMGETISPRIESAFSMAMAPVTASIDGAIAKLSDNSQTGIESLIDRFTESVQGGAGVELRELAQGLANMQVSLAETQRGLQGTGEDFGKRLSAAAEGLERLVASAGDRVTGAQEQAAHSIADAATQAAEGMKLGLAEVMERVRSEIERFAQALQASEVAMVTQVGAMGETTAQTRQVSDAFGRTAQEIRAASTPFVQSGERIARASEAMAQSLQQSASSLDSSQLASKELAASIAQQSERLADMWRGYVAQFDRVDQELGRSVEKLAEATQSQAQTLVDYAQKVDQGLARAVEKLNPLLDGIRENTEDFGDAVESLSNAFGRQAAE